jgi:hypothetical protein
MIVPGTFDLPASHASVIVHVAALLAYANYEQDMITPAWQVDHNILEAANKSTTIRRVMLTGSLVAVMWLPNEL